MNGLMLHSLLACQQLADHPIRRSALSKVGAQRTTGELIIGNTLVACVERIPVGGRPICVATLEQVQVL